MRITIKRKIYYMGFPFPFLIFIIIIPDTFVCPFYHIIIIIVVVVTMVVSRVSAAITTSNYNDYYYYYRDTHNMSSLVLVHFMTSWILYKWLRMTLQQAWRVMLLILSFKKIIPIIVLYKKKFTHFLPSLANKLVVLIHKSTWKSNLVR